MIGSAIGAIIGFLVDFLMKFLSKKAVGITIVVLVYSSFITTYIFIFSMIYKLYNLIHQFLFYISHTSGSVSSDNSHLLCKFYGLLEIMGVISTFQSMLPILISAITAMLVQIVTKEFLKVQLQMTNIFMKAIK